MMMMVLIYIEGVHAARWTRRLNQEKRSHIYLLLSVNLFKTQKSAFSPLSLSSLTLWDPLNFVSLVLCSQSVPPAYQVANLCNNRCSLQGQQPPLTTAHDSSYSYTLSLSLGFNFSEQSCPYQGCLKRLSWDKCYKRFSTSKFFGTFQLVKNFPHQGSLLRNTTECVTLPFCAGENILSPVSKR